MTNNDRISLIEAILENKGYASAILATLGDRVPDLIAACDILASERHTDPDSDRVLYVFEDESCVLIYSGEHAEIG